MAELHFMVKTGVEKFNPEDRKLIRSHVMKGKNLGKIRPSRRGRQDVLSSSSSCSDTSSPDRTRGRDGSSLSRPSSSSTTHPTPDSESSLPPTSSSSTHPTPRSPATIPRQFGSVASAVCFADSVQPATVDVVLQCEYLLVRSSSMSFILQ